MLTFAYNPSTETGMQTARALRRRPLGEMLVSQGRVTRDQLSEALEVQRDNGRRVGSTLVMLGYLEEDELAGFLSAQLDVPSIQRIGAVSDAVRRLVPVDLAFLHTVFPLAADGDSLTLAMADPLDPDALHDIAMATGRTIEPVVAPELVILGALRRQYEAPPTVDTVDLGDADVDLLETTHVHELDFLP
jgi:type IV pilus assembly protein PilB